MSTQVLQVQRIPRRTVMWRVFHWANVLSIVIASLTGTYIADPFFGLRGAEVMEWMRAFHFYAAVVLDLSVVCLGYLYFFSRVDRGALEIRPTRANFVSLREGFLNLLLLGRRKRFDSSRPDSWNAMWFTVLHLLVFFQMFTGFQLYVQYEYGGISSIGSWWPSLLHLTTDWTLWLFGSTAGVRMAHLVTMYLIIAWAMCHLYYEIWRTIVWKESDIAIAFGGYKFARRFSPSRPITFVDGSATDRDGSAADTAAASPADSIPVAEPGPEQGP